MKIEIELSDDEARFLAMHAYYKSQEELDPRRYMAGLNEDGTIHLNQRWATRQERCDRWEAVSRALWPGPIWPDSPR